MRDTFTKRFRESETDQGWFAMGSDIKSNQKNPITQGSYTIAQYLRTLDVQVQLGTKDSKFC
jgi:hypothetical protein